MHAFIDKVSSIGIETNDYYTTNNLMADHEVVKSKSWFWGWFSWSGSSSTMLRAAEKKILSCLKTAYRGWYVDIGPVVGTADKIWTISLNEESAKTPIVLLHGLGAGVALWCLNFDALASQRPVYAIDLLGFGRSSRPVFSSEAKEAEEQLVRSIEEWRREMQLEKFVLLGHSMGGFLAASYTMQHPERVKHLILADPWGFPERPSEVAIKANVPLWVKAIAFVVQPLNPLWAVRVAGPFGQWLIEKTRPDIVKKFSSFLKDDTGVISQYIHQCNAQTPSGESAFHAMMQGFGWAKNPIVKRMDKLNPEIPITLLYGSRSWVDNSAGEAIKQSRLSSYVNVQVITGAGHHVYADKSDIFNKYVLEACTLSDSTQSLLNSHIHASLKYAIENNDLSKIENNTSEPQRIDEEQELDAQRPRSS
ncbi:(Lyso)-N-acylphosphatidylethanolamine lipase-like isoform X2 [Vespa mandarinia]|uniref:(Lyso)-N-acylphosphatidylethanolamine lipase-like isoform X2 n=1 Tax=Vespa mandarinia TaxID=7446 RepID=UPI0016192CB9|nr:(Lyso)-N-acylphosphatidylethanolamine lipase-like isoform X2 [Vespa mandarinia]XP_035741156.1 (Lyso)-N-acylphosphatidylethanolamine lipase-like isoform X2 [Vespa mandarinia]XP_047363558.1 (Lyso)-N-acylphosphatidylethanolamine lipase isoform X1 [Vespa velutina]XP_047363559.1 (Lyso)-N-acylphosphatidylethanolamine lipase isoform X1 [Vespa velutina]XP_047363560.1 (Lyso)-N-acylphosphatidylethanolamine lipase isoform X1 [Vespa velutina]